MYGFVSPQKGEEVNMQSTSILLNLRICLQAETAGIETLHPPIPTFFFF